MDRSLGRYNWSYWFLAALAKRGPIRRHAVHYCKLGLFQTKACTVVITHDAQPVQLPDPNGGPEGDD